MVLVCPRIYYLLLRSTASDPSTSPQSAAYLFTTTRLSLTVIPRRLNQNEGTHLLWTPMDPFFSLFYLSHVHSQAIRSACFVSSTLPTSDHNSSPSAPLYLLQCINASSHLSFVLMQSQRVSWHYQHEIRAVKTFLRFLCASCPSSQNAKRMYV